MRSAGRFGRRLLSVVLVLGLPGCAMLLPTPAERAFVEVDPAMPNAVLMERVAGVLEENRLLNCTIPAREVPLCAISAWRGDITRFDRDGAILELSDFPDVYSNVIGHSARFRRTSDDTLEVTVKGIWTYGTYLPNLAVAKSVARLIEEDLRP